MYPSRLAATEYTIRFISFPSPWAIAQVWITLYWLHVEPG